MERIPQSVAKLVVFKAFSAADHVTGLTGLATLSVQLSKGGGTFADPHAGVTNATEIGYGWYKVNLDTVDTGTLGTLVVRGTHASIDPAELVFDVADPMNGGFGGVPAVAPGQQGGLPTLGAAGQIEAALTDSERNAAADALLGRAGAVDGKTPAEVLRIIAAILAGKVSGAGSGVETFVGLDGLTTRAVVTVDGSGNRTNVTY
jgi:hypothetical protein